MNLTHAREALKSYFGYDEFRPMQADIVAALLSGEDSLVLMPTGGGKSLCYQLPAIIQPGLCVVVSPLIALMKDQVEALRNSGVSAAYINSSQSYDEHKLVQRQAVAGHLDLLYVSPEKLCTSSFVRLLDQLQINLFAIDEAHCVSAWGHDFRPEYAQLRFLKQRFPNVPLVALTATADRVTRHDMVRQLFPNEPRVFTASFDRPNIRLTVLPARSRPRYIRSFIQNRKGQSGIIYCLGRRQTEKLAAKLSASGIRAGFYHAGMSAKERAMTQEAFISDDLPIVCATIAFGMGIDKSNIRWVIHYNTPKNIEGYYQEIGRAGRDGLPSEALLFYTYADVVTIRKLIANSPNKDLQLAKLQRMQAYVDATMCRRNVLLAYFGEVRHEPCGTCDICSNPPITVDGTIDAQKALSALARMRPDRVREHTLIDVLRGTRTPHIMQRGHDQIKTFGAGRDRSAEDWQHIITQLLNMGLIEVAYDHNNALRLNQASVDVLSGRQDVRLIDREDMEQRAEAQVQRQAPVDSDVDENLFEALRLLRREIARKFKKRAYLIFSDATLREMAARKPTTKLDMLEISGVGQHKFEHYGTFFMDRIATFEAADQGHVLGL